MTLPEFILARIAEDEAAANASKADAATTRTLGVAPSWLIGVADRVLAQCEAYRRIVERETPSPERFEWTPDCGGDWCLSGGATSEEPGVGYFANYWPDNTVSVSIYVDGEAMLRSGIVARRSKAECQAFAEDFVRDNLPNASLTLRHLAAIWADHQDYQQEWKP